MFILNSAFAASTEKCLCYDVWLYVGIPGYLDRGGSIATLPTSCVYIPIWCMDNPRTVLGFRSGYMGIPGYLAGEVASIATLYILRVFLYGGQSQECPGKVWLRGNHEIETWTGPSDMHSIYIYILYMCGGQSQECPGMAWLHGNPRILGQGGSLETLLHVHGGQSQECPGKVWLRGNPGILGRGG